MRRREFLAFAGAATAFPRVSVAQQGPRPVPRAPGGRPWLIGALVPSTRQQSDIDSLGPLLKGLGALGYVEGRDYRVAAYYTEGEAARTEPLAQDLVRLDPDLIVAAGAGQATLGSLTSSIPIVAYFGPAVTATSLSSLVGNVARPVGNITGIFSESSTLTGKHCDLVLEIVPNAARIGVLVDASAVDAGKAARNAVATAAEARKFVPLIVDVATPSALAAAYGTLSSQRAEAIIIGSGNLFAGDRQRMALLAATTKLPAVYNEQGYVEVGGLLSYGMDRKGTFSRLAGFADLILRGARVADVPAEAVSTWTMAINLKTAKALGLTIPPTVLFRADLVIE